MKKGLIIKLSVVVIMAMSTTTWGQEVQSSLSDNAALTESIPPEPAQMDAVYGAPCGCNQTMMQPMMVPPAVTNCGCCTPVKNWRRASRCTSCDDCGMVAQVAYQEIIPASTPMRPTSIVTTAPTPAFTQPMINSGCCGNITNSPQSTYITPVSTTNPATTMTDPQYIPTTMNQFSYSGSTCTTCSTPRRFFGRVFRRR